MGKCLPNGLKFFLVVVHTQKIANPSVASWYSNFCPQKYGLIHILARILLLSYSLCTVTAEGAESNRLGAVSKRGDNALHVTDHSTIYPSFDGSQPTFVTRRNRATSSILRDVSWGLWVPNMSSLRFPNASHSVIRCSKVIRVPSISQIVHVGLTCRFWTCSW